MSSSGRMSASALRLWAGIFRDIQSREKFKEEIWLSPMTKAPTPTEKVKKQRDNTKTPP